MWIIQNSLYILALLNTYVIKVITGTESGSGTNANVHIIIFGDQEDTGSSIISATTSRLFMMHFFLFRSNYFEQIKNTQRSIRKWSYRYF